MSQELRIAEAFTFEEMATLIQDKEAAGVEFQVFIRQLEEDAAKANRRVEVARAIAGMCSATKTRKPRSDKGKQRKKRNAPESTEPKSR